MATVTLDRPQTRNAQTPALWRDLAATRSRLPSGVRVVVVCAQGPSFSAGLDRRMFTAEGIPGEDGLFQLGARSADGLHATIAGFQAAFSWLCDADLITVAAVQGHAIGAGFQLALACDLRIVADDAQLSMKETVLGLVPDLGGTRPLVESIGYSRALELCVSGRSMGAAEAVECGLALRRVPGEGLSAATDELVDSLLAAPHGAVTETKALLQGATGRGHAEQLAAERSAQVRRIAALTGLAGLAAPSTAEESAEGVPD